MSTPSARRSTQTPPSAHSHSRSHSHFASTSASTASAASLSTCTDTDVDDGEGEAYELQERHPTATGGDAPRTQADPGSGENEKKAGCETERPGWWGERLADFWSTHVDMVVDIGASRDHLALERTFLGYLRTGSMLSMTGVLVAQMLVLSQPAADLASSFGFHSIGKPVATVFFVLAIATVLLGARRAYTQQHAMIAGKAVVGGMELIGIGAALFLLILAVFGFMIALDIIKEYKS